MSTAKKTGLDFVTTVADAMRSHITAEGDKLNITDDGIGAALAVINPDISFDQFKLAISAVRPLHRGWQLAAGEQAVEVMKDQPSLNQMIGNLVVGDFSSNVTLNRRDEVRNPATGAVTERFGNMHASMSFKGDGNYALVRDHLRTLGQSAFGGGSDAALADA